MQSIKPEEDKEFFVRIHRELVNNERAIRAVYELLKDYDVSAFRPESDGPDSAGLRSAKNFNFDRVEGGLFMAFLYSYIHWSKDRFKSEQAKIDAVMAHPGATTVVSVPRRALLKAFKAFLDVKVSERVAGLITPHVELDKLSERMIMIQKGKRYEPIKIDAHSNTRIFSGLASVRCVHINFEVVKAKLEKMIGPTDIEDLVDGCDNIFEAEYAGFMDTSA